MSARRKGLGGSAIGTPPDVPAPFLRTREGRRVLALAVLFVILLGVIWLTRPYPEHGRDPAGGSDPDSAASPPVVDDLAAREAPPPAGEAPPSRFGPGSLAASLRDVADGQDFAETAGYRRLLRALYDHTPPDTGAAAALDVDAAIRAPEAWRGSLVRVRGLVVDLRACKLLQPLWGTTDVWRAFVTDAAGEHAVAVDLLQPPPALELRRDVVDVDGIFYRVVGYENRANTTRRVPWVLARSLHVVDVRRTDRIAESPPRPLLIAVTALIGAWGLLRLTWLRPRRRRLPPGPPDKPRRRPPGAARSAVLRLVRSLGEPRTPKARVQIPSTEGDRASRGSER